MKEFKTIHEEEIKKSTEEEINREKERFTITIVDNFENKTLLNEKTNMIAGVVNIPSKGTKTAAAIQQFCSSSCNGVVAKASLDALRELELELAKSVLKGMLASLGGK